MPDIIKKITALGELERKSLVDSVMDSRKGLREALCLLLNRTEEPAREAFYKSLPVSWAADFRERVKGELKLTPAREEKALAEIAGRIDNIAVEMEKINRLTARAGKQVLKFRGVMKAGFLKMSKVMSDQTKGLPRGPLQKPYPEGCEVTELPKPDKAVLKKPGLFDCISDRRSRRKFNDEPLSLAELSYLLWATQGVRQMRTPLVTFRTVPSGGSMHPFETYLAVNNVTGLRKGIYLYQPLDHKLVRLFTPEHQPEKLVKAALGQPFAGGSAVTFIWSVVPYKTEWRYTLEAKKIILQDSGHMCQNLYLACESINCGTCAIGAYNQKLFDKLCGLDGRDEFVVYVAPVGRV